jgi:hypothetical protein
MLLDSRQRGRGMRKDLRCRVLSLLLYRHGLGQELSQRTIEVKKMLTALIQKLTADRWPLKALIRKISSILGYF